MEYCSMLPDFSDLLWPSEIKLHKEKIRRFPSYLYMVA